MQDIDAAEVMEWKIAYKISSVAACVLVISAHSKFGVCPRMIRVALHDSRRRLGSIRATAEINQVVSFCLTVYNAHASSWTGKLVIFEAAETAQPCCLQCVSCTSFTTSTVIPCSIATATTMGRRSINISIFGSRFSTSSYIRLVNTSICNVYVKLSTINRLLYVVSDQKSIARTVFIVAL